MSSDERAMRHEPMSDGDANVSYWCPFCQRAVVSGYRWQRHILVSGYQWDHPRVPPTQGFVCTSHRNSLPVREGTVMVLERTPAPTP